MKTKTTRVIKIYNVDPSGFKPTSIQVREVKSAVFNCRFLDLHAINEFKTIGFKVSYANQIENISLTGKLTIEYATSIWNEYLKKKEKPDIEFLVDDFKD